MSRTISGTYSTGITLTSTVNNPVTVTAQITASTGTALYGLGGKGGTPTTWTISNSGVIKATSGDGVHLGIGASYVQNTSVTNLTGGTISGSGFGIYINGTGTVTNQAGALISGGSAKGVYLYRAGTIVNSGTILSTSSFAVYARAGGSVTNLAGGTISGGGGVRLQTVGTFANAGTVIGTNSVSGAVTFNASNAVNRLIVSPGAVFSGNIKGGTGVVELASAASVGTLSGFGTSTLISARCKSIPGPPGKSPATFQPAASAPSPSAVSMPTTRSTSPTSPRPAGPSRAMRWF